MKKHLKTIAAALLGILAAAITSCASDAATLTGLEIKEPEKSQYYEGEELDLTGLEVTAVYSDLTTKVVTDYKITGFDSSKTGEQTITVTWEDKSAEFKINIIAMTALELYGPDNTLYYTGDELDLTGLVVTVIYADSTSKTVTDYTIEGFDNSKSGEQTISVTYKNHTAVFSVEVTAVELVSLKVTTRPSRQDYFIGDEFNREDWVITGTYNNGMTREVTDYTLSGFYTNKAATNFYEDLVFSCGNVSVKARVLTTVKEVEVESLYIKSKPTKTEYFKGDAFDATGLVVIAYYNNNTNEEAADYKITGFSSATVGEDMWETLKVTYGGVSKEFSICITVKAVEVTSLEILSLPSKTEYFVGDTIDTTGMEVKASYNNGKSESVTGFSISGFNSSTAGTKKETLTVSYKSFSETFTMTFTFTPVVLTAITVTSLPSKTEYFTGDAFDSTGFAATGTYSNGTTSALTGYTLTGFDSSSAGSKTETMTVAKDGIETTFSYTVTITDIAVSSFTVTSMPSKTEYLVGDEMDSTGLEVTAVWNNGETKNITDYTLTGFDSSAAGSKTLSITVTWEDQRTTFSYEVNFTAVLTGLTVTSAPSKTNYGTDEAFDSTGLVLTANYNDGTSVTVTDYTMTGFDTSKAGQKTETLTFGYGGKSVSYDYAITIIYTFHETVTACSTGGYYFGDWPQTVLPSDTDVSIDETTTKTMGFITWCLGSDGNWYMKSTEYACDSDYTYSDGTTVGMNESTSRWFKAEPIKWYALTSDYNSTGKTLLFASKVLTSAIPFYNDYDTRKINSTKVYVNNYMYSNVRAWLNGSYETKDTQTKTYTDIGFLQSAFTTSAQNLIEVTTVKNGYLSTQDSTGSISPATDRICDDTSDKIFLLSTYEASDTDYGFGKYSATYSSSNRMRYATDYAFARHADKNSSTSKNTEWLLRSPSSTDYMVETAGPAGSLSGTNTTSVCFGIVPALCVDLSE